MDFTLILMLAALALVYTAWRGARRENQRLRAAREQEIERRSSSLEPLERANGRGYVVVLPDGARADEYETDWEQDGIDIVRLDAFPATPEAATIPAFAPGTAVELIVDDEDEHIIWVWDRGMTLRAGRVPDARAAEISTRANDGQIGDCIVLWETLAGGQRSGLDILITHRDMPIES
jgi:hypothetical protein